VYCKSRNIT